MVKRQGVKLEDRPQVMDVVALQGDQLAQLAAVEQLPGVQELPVETHGLADEELQARLPHQRDQPLGVVQAGDHRLGADDVLARLERRHAVFRVQRVGREHGDHVDVVAGHQRR